MENKNIQDQVYKIIYNAIQTTPISNEQPFWDSEEMDSLDCLYIIMQCEDKFHIRITDDEIKTLRKIGDLVNIVTRKSQTIESKLIEIGDTISKINADMIRRSQILNTKIK